jgi:superfamily II DNA or RNA helicase
MKVSMLKLQISKADLVSYEQVLHLEQNLQKQPASAAVSQQLKNIQMQKHRTTSRIKMGVVPHTLQNLCGTKKTIIWYEYDAMRDAILAQLPASKTLTIGGDTLANKRQQILNQYSSDSTKQYLVLSIMACYTGLNIVCAELMVFADNKHTPAILLQCMARMHRIGQTKPTEAIYLIAMGTYDEKILDVLDRKDSLVNKTLKEERKLVIERNESSQMFKGWEFEHYGISAPQVRSLDDEEYNKLKPLVNESQDQFILRTTKEVVYDPQLINLIRRRDFACINQLNLNQIAKWTNVFEYEKALPLYSEEKTMRVLEINENPIAIFMQRKDLL